MNLSHPKRHLVTPDPSPDSYLPVDDRAWDDGVSVLYMSAYAFSY